MTFDTVQEEVGNIGKYQAVVFTATQLGYVCVTGSMLSTIYDNILPEIDCSSSQENVNNRTREAWTEADFRSLLLEFGYVCEISYLPTTFSTAVMAGGVVGAVSSGYAADRLGRKLPCILTLTGCAAANLAIAGLALLNWVLALILFFVLGLFGGGYMVVNLVMLLESVGGNRWRLGATAFNGWPFGLICMGLIGYLANYWRWYHVALALAAVPCILGLFLIEESARWLVQHSRVNEAEVILKKIASINGKTVEVGISNRIGSGSKEVTVPEDRTYSYWDLIRYRSICANLLALFYSWLASSIISFGIYFNMGTLWGNPFLKMFLLGVFKGTTGVIPFLVSRWVGRKPVLLVAVSWACISCWAVVIFHFVEPESQTSPWLTAFSLAGASAIDPIWKVNHLYSAELFPTVVRNMARAVCNLGSRLGSVIGPQVAFLASTHFAAPYLIFGILSVFHVLVCVFFLPETKGRQLPDTLPDVKRFKEKREDYSDGEVEL